jgi:hypothetical protein
MRYCFIKKNIIYTNFKSENLSPQQKLRLPYFMLTHIAIYDNETIYIK